MKLIIPLAVLGTAAGFTVLQPDATAPPVVVATAQTSVVPHKEITAPSGEQISSFRLRPFAAVRSSAAHEWTAEDGKAPDVIRVIAHSEAEVQRLTEENARVQRRQLVYRREPAWVLVERAKASGGQVRRLTLPGMDGREVEMEVTRADLAPSGLSGTFAGRVAGNGNSLVTLAFDMGREAFTMVSPDDDLFLQGHPREPGEIIVTSFQPDQYLPLPGGEPVRTTP